MEDAPLARTGSWGASTGELSVTKETLQQAADASRSNLLDMAAISLEHTDGRIESPAFMQDGELSCGQVTNLRVADDEDGPVPIGDCINISEGLAGRLPVPLCRSGLRCEAAW